MTITTRREFIDAYNRLDERRFVYPYELIDNILDTKINVKLEFLNGKTYNTDLFVENIYRNSLPNRFLLYDDFKYSLESEKQEKKVKYVYTRDLFSLEIINTKVSEAYNNIVNLKKKGVKHNPEVLFGIINEFNKIKKEMGEEEISYEKAYQYLEKESR